MSNDDKALNKFICYLREYQSELEVNIWGGLFLTIKDDFDVDKVEALRWLKKEEVVVSNFLDIFENLNCRTGEVFFQFYYLSDLLEKSNLSVKECSAIIFMMIKRNLKADLLEENSVFVDIKAIEKYHFKTMTSEEVWDFICKVGIEELTLQAKENPDLQIKLDEIIRFSEKHAADVEEFKKQNAIIQHCYFEKINSYDEVDISQILSSLRYLTVSEKILKCVEISLEKDYQKRKNNDLRQQKVQLCWTKTEAKNYFLSDRQYNVLRRELESYYHVYQNKLMKNITYSEMIHCLSLMYRLGIDEANIDQFLLKYRLTCDSIQDPIQWFVFSYEKLLYHQKDVRVMTSFQQLLEYMSDIFVVGDEEYFYVKEEMQKEQNKIEHLLIDNYDYEKNYAKKLLKGRRFYE